MGTFRVTWPTGLKTTYVSETAETIEAFAMERWGHSIELANKLGVTVEAIEGFESIPATPVAALTPEGAALVAAAVASSLDDDDDNDDGAPPPVEVVVRSKQG